MTDNFDDLTPAQMVGIIRLQQAMLARQERELEAYRAAQHIPVAHAVGIGLDWPGHEPPAKRQRFAGIAALVTAAAVVALLWVAL